MDRSEQNISDTSEVRVAFTELGISGKVRVRDLWTQKDMGVFRESFGQKLPLHGAGLYRLSPQ